MSDPPARPALPDYDDLPVTPGAPPGSSWGLWGEHDVLGCLNLLGPDQVRRGLACARGGVVFSLNLELGLPDPPLFGREAFVHKVSWLDHDAGHDDELSGWNTQSSSQWDGFRHIRHPEHGFYGGVDDDEHGVDHWARRGIVGRAVLADVGRWREEQGRPLRMDDADPIEPSDLEATLAAQGVVVEPGDILLIRTGWVTWYRSLDQVGRRGLAGDLHSPGLRPGLDTARMLWDLHIAAVAADNPALEVWPPGALATPGQIEEILAKPARLPELFVHTSLLPLLGLPIGELWDLDALAEDCASDGNYYACLTSAALNLKSGVASPPNALAIK
ncbi:MAG: cyclase family protein [Acidimicrobiales bacterium]